MSATNKMRVYLLRHGEAEDRAPDGSFDDDARELTQNGRDALAAACRTYSQLFDGTPRILHSPLSRARQSAAILGEATGVAVDAMVETDDLRPGGRASQVVDMIQGEFLGGCPNLALVGHEPLLGGLLGLLSTGNDRHSMPMAKGMLACIEIADAQVMIGKLTALISQGHARGMA